MSNSPKQIAESFYLAFQKKSAESMCVLYSDTILFSDPVFPKLAGEAARNMWRMLCQNSTDLKIDYRVLFSSDKSAVVEWNAWYTFSKTGRKVHNIVHSTLEVEDGLIVKHTDLFSFWRWSRQALGIPGICLGWTPLLKGKVQETAAKSLLKFSRN